MRNKVLNYIITFLLITIAIILFIKFNNNRDDFTFKINDNDLTLVVESSTIIDYTISDKSIPITWKSDNPNIVTVDDNGRIIGKSIGLTTITGQATKNGNTKYIYCAINIVAENYNIKLENISLPDGEILMSINSSYEIPITYEPNNAYIKSINYKTNNNNISVNDGIIKGIKSGETLLTITVNDYISKQIKVNVIDKQISPQIITPVSNVILDNNTINIYNKETKSVNYTIEPNNGIVFSAQWNSSNNNIVTVNDNGIISAVNPGNATVSLIINNNIKRTINVNVNQGITDIKLNYMTKKIIKVNETFTLYPTILPIDIKDKNIKYESSDTNILSVDSNGNVIAKKEGNAIVTIKDSTSTITKSIPFTVIPNQGIINTDKIIWNFSKDEDTIPKRADNDFFSNLAKNGKGTFSNNQYIYNNYTYDIKNSILTINNSDKILMRMYYPENKDLSTLNTFTFIGGVGEIDFYNYFYKIDNHRDIIKSSGIIILIANGSTITHRAENVVHATNFVKSIINQNVNARNIVGGYSNGGPIAGRAANIGSYQKIMLFNTTFDGVSQKTHLSNTEIVLYSAVNDSWRGKVSFLDSLYTNNFKNVTIVTNDQDLINRYSTKYLVINPGNTMISGHTYNNITNSNFFSFGCD